MRGGLASLVHELLAIAANGDQEGVERHGGIDGDFATELVFDFALFDSLWAVLLENLVQTLDTHVDGCVSECAACRIGRVDEIVEMVKN